jgi:hypothetical protein
MVGLRDLKGSAQKLNALKPVDRREENPIAVNVDQHSKIRLSLRDLKMEAFCSRTEGKR